MVAVRSAVNLKPRRALVQFAESGNGRVWFHTAMMPTRKRLYESHGASQLIIPRNSLFGVARNHFVMHCYLQHRGARLRGHHQFRLHTSLFGATAPMLRIVAVLMFGH